MDHDNVLYIIGCFSVSLLVDVTLHAVSFVTVQSLSNDKSEICESTTYRFSQSGR